LSRGLAEWASVAEIVSSIAVVVTLMLLVAGIRENTEVTRASMYDSSIDSLNAFRARIIDSRDVANLWNAYRSGDVESLDTTDRRRISQLVGMLFGIYEKSYYARQYGVIGSSEWSRFEVQICLQFDSVSRSLILKEYLESTMTEEFMGYISSLCQQ